MKPNGVRVKSSATTTPMKPSGATESTSASREKLWSWTISTISTTADHQRHLGEHR